MFLNLKINHNFSNSRKELGNGNIVENHLDTPSGTVVNQIILDQEVLVQVHIIWNFRKMTVNGMMKGVHGSLHQSAKYFEQF